MVTPIGYTVIVALVVVERLVELILARRNTRYQLDRGGIEHGAGHYPVMVLLHSALLVGCLAETWFLDRPFIPALGFPMIGMLILSQVVRYWVVMTLGQRWTTRVIVVPGDTRIETGPYRFLNHPNYVAVVAEGMALPLIYSNWITAAIFSAANAVLLATRVRIENKALRRLSSAIDHRPSTIDQQ